MVQLNLLPDVKLEYIKTKRTKRLVLSLSFLVIAVSVSFFIFMLIFVDGIQKKHMSNLDKDIDEKVTTIQNTPEVDKILTIQNQLAVINGKHDEKPTATRLLPYLAQVLPNGSKLTELKADFKTNTITITGNTTDINAINKFVDTLKFAEYTIKPDAKGKPFSQVVLSSYTTDPGKAEFTVTAKFDPVIFDNANEVTLVIPGIVSTRSSTEKPNIQFDQKSQSLEGGQ